MSKGRGCQAEAGGYQTETYQGNDNTQMEGGATRRWNPQTVVWKELTFNFLRSKLLEYRLWLLRTQEECGDLKRGVVGQKQAAVIKEQSGSLRKGWAEA